MERKHMHRTIGSSENVELYFETDRLEETRDRMQNLGIPFLHDIEVQSWGQRVFRIKDPDGYVVEIGERM